MVNIGQSIKDELNRQERTVSWMARKLNCTRAAVYRIFSKNSIVNAKAVVTDAKMYASFFMLFCFVQAYNITNFVPYYCFAFVFLRGYAYGVGKFLKFHVSGSTFLWLTPFLCF